MGYRHSWSRVFCNHASAIQSMNIKESVKHQTVVITYIIIVLTLFTKQIPRIARVHAQFSNNACSGSCILLLCRICYRFLHNLQRQKSCTSFLAYHSNSGQYLHCSARQCQLEDCIPQVRINPGNLYHSHSHL